MKGTSRETCSLRRGALFGLDFLTFSVWIFILGNTFERFGAVIHARLPLANRGPVPGDASSDGDRSSVQRGARPEDQHADSGAQTQTVVRPFLCDLWASGCGSVSWHLTLSGDILPSKGPCCQQHECEQTDVTAGQPYVTRRLDLYALIIPSLGLNIDI